MKYYLAYIALLLPLMTLGQLNLLNDEFEDPTTLSQWQNINDTEGWGAEQLESHDIDITLPGKLQMMPFTSSWYEDYRGTLLYKAVEGDFTITTQVTVTNRAGNGIPSSDFSLGGLMIRTPRNFTNGATGWTALGENYIFLALGRANGNNGPHLEVKTTNPMNTPYSNLEITPVSTATDVQIRLARLGRYIVCLVRFPGQNWEVHRVYDRPDMPNAMQIGFVTYTDWDKVSSYDPIFQNSHILNSSLSPDPSNDPNRNFNPDLIAGFDFARFTNVTLPPNLMGMNLTQVSDMELLSFLGFDSEPITTGITDHKSILPTLKIYPNPATDILNLELSESKQVQRYEIYDLHGRKVQSAALVNNTIPIENLEQGMYSLLVFDRQNSVIKTLFLKE